MLKKYKDHFANTYSAYLLSFSLFLPIMIISMFGVGKRIDRTNMNLSDLLILLMPNVFFYSFLFLIFLGSFLYIKKTNRYWVFVFLSLILFLIYFNFLILELIGNAYSITTGDTDFDYSLIIHGLLNIKSLIPVFFGSVSLHYFIISCVIFALLVILQMVVIITYSKKENTTPSNKIYGNIVILSVSLLLLLNFNLSLKFSNVTRINKVPLPLSLISLNRSFKNTVLNFYGKKAPPIRDQFPLDAKLIPINAQNTKKPNLVYIIMESTRYKSLFGVQKYLNIAPYLSKITKNAIVFDRAYSMVPHTSKSLESILCSIEPSQGLAIVSSNPEIGIPTKCLAGLLKGIGYSSLFISPADPTFEGRRAFLENANFDQSILGDSIDGEGFSTVNYFGYEDDSMLEPIKEWLTEKKGGPFFLSLLTITPHHHYTLPEKFERKKFNEDRVLNQYHNTLKYQDNFLEKVMQIFKNLDLMENTLFVIMADHGEGFSEHGRLQHDTVIFDEGLHVPVIIFGTRISKPYHIINPISLVDIMPTSLKLMGFRINYEENFYAGTDALSRPVERPIYSYCYRKRYCASVIKGKWKFIDHFDFHENQLFDLINDPQEKINLISEKPDKAKEFAIDIRNWVLTVNAYHRKFYQQKLTNN